MQYEKDMTSKYTVMFLEARTFLLSYSRIAETKKERITTYSDENGGICHMRTMPYGIDLGFLKGAKMVDEDKLLTGKGKLLRVLQVEKLDLELLKYFVEQAISINQKKN